MDTFVWDEHYNTGLAMVDQHHHHLIDLINRLGESLIGGKVGEDALQVAFEDLADYSSYHFAEEEKLMVNAGIDPRHLSMHRQYHKDFVIQMSVMWNSRSSMSSPAEVLHGFLRAWLGFHILGVDQVMSQQLSLIDSGHSPAEAFEIVSTRKDTAIDALLLALQNLYHVLSVQNTDLSVANQVLEKRVEQRTSELALANQTLLGLNHQLEALSNSDGLLGIANRRYFDAQLEAEWGRARREQQPLSLLMIDVDNFKHYNDKYGHQAGDHCLQAVTQAARSVLKRSGDLLARYGGEELVVILANTDLKGAILVAKNIQRELDQRHIPHTDAPIADHVTVSIGAATMIPSQNTSSTLLIAAADRGLYMAKEKGRNRVCTE